MGFFAAFACTHSSYFSGWAASFGACQTKVQPLTGCESWKPAAGVESCGTFGSATAPWPSASAVPAKHAFRARHTTSHFITLLLLFCAADLPMPEQNLYNSLTSLGPAGCAEH